MTILHISDTHNLHSLLTDLPAADVIVHSGDFTQYGTTEEVFDFLYWFFDLPYKHKIFVTGNHDTCLWDATDIEGLPDNCLFLQDKLIEVNGVRFFGMSYGNYAMPTDVDVIISHEPPLGILDTVGNKHFGNKSIAFPMGDEAPMFHLFGHAHTAFGKTTIGKTTYLNSACTDHDYSLTNKHYQLLTI